MGRAAPEARFKDPWWIYSDNNDLHLCNTLYSAPAVEIWGF